MGDLNNQAYVPIQWVESSGALVTGISYEIWADTHRCGKLSMEANPKDNKVRLSRYD
jgi:hypothetical protein